MVSHTIAFKEEETKHRFPSLVLATKRVYELEMEVQRLKSVDEEVASLKQQIVSLKERYQKEKDQNKLLQEQLKTHSQQQNSQSKSELDESLRKNKQQERVIHFLRERAETAQLELQQLRNEFQNSKEKILEQPIRTESQATTSLDGKQIELLQQMLTSVRSDKEQLEKFLEKAKEALEEKEQAVKQAQQHLAKKMKDVAVLTENNEQNKNRIQELQKSLNEAQNRLMEVQGVLDQKQKQAKVSTEQLEEQLRTADVQLKKWEEKYFQIFEKLQASDLRNNALKSIEDRFLHVQSLISHLNSFLLSAQEPQAHSNGHEHEQKIRYKQTPFD